MAAGAAIVGIISTLVSAAGSVSQAQAANKQGDFQALVAGQQAAAERSAAAANERDYRKSQSARLAQIRASMGASGTDTSTGTSLLSLSDFEGESELNALRIRSGGLLSARRLDQQASLYSMAGQSGQAAGYAQAGSSLLTGISSSFN